MQDSTIKWKGDLRWMARFTSYPPDGVDAPARSFHEEDWIDYATNRRFRDIDSVPADSTAELSMACNGTTILEMDLKSGQSQSRPLPKFAQRIRLSQTLACCWAGDALGPDGTGLTEMALYGQLCERRR